MRIAVVGAGGVGGFLGARLRAADQDVAVLARGAHLAAIRKDGLRLQSPLGDLTAQPTTASDDPAAIGPVDVVLFAVKLYDVAEAAAAITPLLGPQTAVITLQNGIDAPASVAAAVGPGHVLGGVAQIAAVVAEPGLIRHGGPFARFAFGELDGRRTERVARLAQAFQAAGIDHEVPADIQRAIWTKMVFLSSFSGMTALVRLPIGPIREDPEARSMLARAIEEAVAVAVAEGIGFDASEPARLLETIDGLPTTMRSSLLEDLERGRRLELPWLSGAIVRLGREHGVPTPTHETIQTALKLHEHGRSG